MDQEQAGSTAGGPRAALTRADRDLAGLTVLALLLSGPQHTYEMHRMMVDTRKDFVTGLPRSMYHAVERLEKSGSVEPVASVRDSSKPERTVYAITAAGRTAVRERIERLLAVPDPDATLFIAALSFLACLPQRRAAAALQERCAALDEQIAAAEADLGSVPAELPRVLLVEGGFAVSRARSEAEWVRGLLADVDSGALSWPDDVRLLFDGPPP